MAEVCKKEKLKDHEYGHIHTAADLSLILYLDIPNAIKEADDAENKTK